MRNSHYHSARYQGYCLARRHGALEVMAATRDLSRCHRHILAVALREIGKERLLDIMDRPKNAVWVYKLLFYHGKRFGRKSRRRLIARFASSGDYDRIYCALKHIAMTVSERAPLVKAVAKNRFHANWLLEHGLEHVGQPALTADELQTLRGW